MNKPTPAPWSVDSTPNEGEYGNNGPDTRSGFNSFAIIDAEGRVLFDSLNRDGSACEVTEDYDEDGGSAWDAQAKADAEHAVKCVNEHDELRWVVNAFLEWHEGAPCPEGLFERARAAVPCGVDVPLKGGE